jgi:alkaline phosphatase D
MPISFGATCCTKGGLPLDTIAHAGGRSDFSFFCLLGDNVYADPSVTVAEYRQKYAEILGSAAYLKLREAMSLIATWDDHEVVNDWDPEKISRAQWDAALQTFFESLPIRRSTEDPARIYRSLRHGRTLEVFVLDTHGERRPSTRKTAAAQYLSPAQMAWLKDGLSRSEAVFKVILNSTPITLFPDETDPTLSWGGYAAQRTEILSHIDQKGIRGVLWISGDYHFPCVGRVSRSGPGSNAVEALTGPANQTPSGRGRAFGPPQIDWAGDVNNYLAVHLDPAAGTARLVFHSGIGVALQERTYSL